MKVFLSWSGDLSHRVACVFRDWLPSVLQSVKPYVSSEDIDKGTRWSTDIAKELELSAFGIMFITHENIDAPWINFEAGALSKTVEKSKVSPFLFNIKRSDVKGPLLQFQSTIFDKEDVFKLVTSINNSSPETDKLEEVRLLKVFEVWWSQLETELANIKIPETHTKSTTAKRIVSEVEPILEELLELARNQHKLLRSPEELLPPGYLQYAFSQSNDGPHGAQQVDPDAVEFLMTRFERLKFTVFEARDKSIDKEIFSEISDIVSSLENVIDYIRKQVLDNRRDFKSVKYRVKRGMQPS